jgi:hypothetical protein
VAAIRHCTIFAAIDDEGDGCVGLEFRQWEYEAALQAVERRTGG